VICSVQDSTLSQDRDHTALATSPPGSDPGDFVRTICLVPPSWDARGQALADIDQPTVQPAVKQRR
jgi:hypothetical protein